MRKFHRLTVLLLALLLLWAMAAPVSAKDVVDMSRIGSITVTVKLPKDLSSLGTLTLYRVGDIYYDQVDDPATTKDDRGYKFAPVPELNDGTLSLLDLEKKDLAEEVFKQVEAKKLKKAETKKILYDSAEKICCAEFASLAPGLYLLVQEEAASGYYKLAPFLVSVPYYVNDSYVYDVTAEAKAELEKVPETTKPKGDRLPQTGQLNWPVPTLAAGGMLLIAVGWMLRSKKQEENA